MTVWIHTHLPRLQAGNTPDVISVKTPGKRVDYAAWVSLQSAEFRVFQPGRKRCLETGVRNVHAWVVGEEIFSSSDPTGRTRPAGWRTALYDPWKGPYFVDGETLAPVHAASFVIQSGKNVWYQP